MMESRPRDPGLDETEAFPGNGLHFNLLRSSHIFATVVKEILEEKLLREISPDRLTLSQFRLLKVISLGGAHQVGEIATFLGVSPAAATKAIDKLESLGLITRTRSTLDRRATLVSASRAGLVLVERYENLKTERLEPVLETFSRDELNLFSRLLDKFALGVIRREDTRGGTCLKCAAYCEEHCPVGVARGVCPFERLRHGGRKAEAEKA